MYASESWEFSKSDCERLLVFERRILRIMYGLVNIKGERRKRYNDIGNLYTNKTNCLRDKSAEAEEAFFRIPNSKNRTNKALVHSAVR